jgi:hypothetical protein
MTHPVPNESGNGPVHDGSNRAAAIPEAATAIAVEQVPGYAAQAVTIPPGVNALTATGRSVTRALATAGYHLVRLGPAGLTGIVASVAAAVLAFAALVDIQRNSADLTVQIAAARHRPAVVRPETQLENLVSSLPGRDQMPAVVGRVMQQAALAGVSLTNGHYTYSPPTGTQVARYELEFPVKAQYPSIRDFINRTLTEVPAAALDKLSIQRKVVGDPTVTANVQFVVFVRGGAGK